MLSRITLLILAATAVATMAGTTTTANPDNNTMMNQQQMTTIDDNGHLEIIAKRRLNDALKEQYKAGARVIERNIAAAVVEFKKMVDLYKQKAKNGGGQGANDQVYRYQEGWSFLDMVLKKAKEVLKDNFSSFEDFKTAADAANIMHDMGMYTQDLIDHFEDHHKWKAWEEEKDFIISSLYS